MAMQHHSCKYDTFNYLIIIPTTCLAIHCCVLSEAVQMLNITCNILCAHIAFANKGRGGTIACIVVAMQYMNKQQSLYSEITAKQYFITSSAAKYNDNYIIKSGSGNA
jgi:hypothetical protein